MNALSPIFDRDAFVLAVGPDDALPPRPVTLPALAVVRWVDDLNLTQHETFSHADDGPDFIALAKAKARRVGGVLTIIPEVAA